MYNELTSNHSATGLRIGLVVSRYNHEITSALREGAIDCFREAGGRDEDLTIAHATGAFELPAICRALASTGEFDGLAALGCVIQGETTHFDHICQATAGGLMQAGLATEVPVAFGVLTCQTVEQARARAGGDRGNKGVEAMISVIETARTLQAIRSAGERS